MALGSQVETTGDNGTEKIPIVNGNGKEESTAKGELINLYHSFLIYSNSSK